MKKRLIYRNIIDAQDDYNKIIKSIKNKALYFNIFYIVSIPVIIAVFVLISIKTGVRAVVFIPVFVPLYIKGFSIFKSSFEIFKLFNKDYSRYDVFMNDRLKTYRINSFDIQRAKAIYQKYINDSEKHYDEIAVLLNNELSNKPPNILLISVLCGLIFISDEQSCKELLIKANTRGAASVLVFKEWLLCCYNKSKYSSEELKEQFINFWDNFNG